MLVKRKFYIYPCTRCYVHVIKRYNTASNWHFRMQHNALDCCCCCCSHALSLCVRSLFVSISNGCAVLLVHCFCYRFWQWRHHVPPKNIIASDHDALTCILLSICIKCSFIYYWCGRSTLAAAHVNRLIWMKSKTNAVAMKVHRKS